jgi:hypothetical protein
LALIGLFAIGTANARPVPPVTEAEIRDAIRNVQDLASGLQNNLATYREHLKRAMKTYGQEFYDPVVHRKVAGFDDDIQTGDPGQIETAKLAIFGILIQTAGIRTDPDLLRDWAEVERLLDRYQSIVDTSGEVFTRSWLYVAGDQNIPASVMKQFTSKWRSAAKKAEEERNRALAARPECLELHETFSVKATDGPNLHFTFLGVQFGRELGNAVALSQLTYVGQTPLGHSFLLTTLNTRRSKTRTDTFVKSRAILVHSNADDSARYGHAVTSHEYDGYTVVGARIADVVGREQDWLWKTLAPSSPELPPVSELEQVIRGIDEGRRSIELALDAFKALAANAASDNDKTLKAEAKTVHKKVRLPEQDLTTLFPGTRHRLYASRALSAGDPRFVSALEDVMAASSQAESEVLKGQRRFGEFNGVLVQTAPALPWKNIDKLSVEFMQATNRLRRARLRSADALPAIPTADDPTFSFPAGPPPQVIVSQVLKCHNENDGGVSFIEHILRDVHWALKGIERREYISEFITSSPSGIHRVEGVASSRYLQGPGGIQHAFPQDPERDVGDRNRLCGPNSPQR